MPIANNTPLRAEQNLEDSGGDPARDTHQDPSEPTQNSGDTKTGFFQIRLETIDEMAEHGLVKPILAYLVLARHTKGRDHASLTPAGSLSTAGVQAVQKKAGLSRKESQEALEWLCFQGFIQAAEEAKKALGEDQVPGSLGKGSSKCHQVRWYLEPIGDTRLALPNELVDGLSKGKAGPPLHRFCKLGGDTKRRIDRHQARLDTLMLLLHLYQHQDIQACGGIDPRTAFYREYYQIDTEFREAVTPIEEGWALVEVTQVRIPRVNANLLTESLGYIKDGEQRKKRFSNAFSTLEKLGFIYETLGVWTANPQQDRNAELEYTLYIHDKSARNGSSGDPYLQLEINRAAARLGYLNHLEFADEEYAKGLSLKNSGCFRYLCPVVNDTPDHVALGVFRLRYRPGTHDTGLGMQRERERVQEWRGYLEEVCGNNLVG